ncbi:MAG: ATP-binding cassette domain-containing protein [Verrucomicrobiota bacterium]
MTPNDTPAVFEINDASVRFAGGKEIGGLNLRVCEGEKVVIRGQSGSGKTTMLRLLLGFAQPKSGEVKFRGADLTPEAAWRLRQEVAFVNQAPDGDTVTVHDALTRLCKEQPDRPQLQAALERLELEKGALKQLTSNLSGGERQRVALAAASLLKRRIFLLDEPTAALDEANKTRVADLFLDEENDWTVVVVSHDEVWRQPEHATVIEL